MAGAVRKQLKKRKSKGAVENCNEVQVSIIDSVSSREKSTAFTQTDCGDLSDNQKFKNIKQRLELQDEIKSLEEERNEYSVKNEHLQKEVYKLNEQLRMANEVLMN
ncbi:uncharacterized protein LOC143228041 [Tachypleus tridentatus]|uniref:uncharacterized protein LOC143228041 n=1 Tax=Tachypleus tridentatus TaxID=6853 RepID=UPI003FD0408D